MSTSIPPAPAPVRGQAPAVPDASATSTGEQQIDELRVAITAIDDEIVGLVDRRIALSRQVGVLRMAAGGTRLALSREQAIVDRFTRALGADGTALAMLLLRASRGRL